ncbi:MAG TPA: hypothetical protein VHW01_04750, partial [Polyangiaceae bacterium]|nr:hypothetical protein [Polyangiaceae bacterium]
MKVRELFASSLAVVTALFLAIACGSGSADGGSAATAGSSARGGNSGASGTLGSSAGLNGTGTGGTTATGGAFGTGGASGSSTSSGGSSDQGGAAGSSGSSGATSSGGAGAASGTLYVAPNGSDSNPGTIAEPLKTVAKARDLVAGMTATMSADITVYLRAGTYPQPSTLEFGNADSGKNGFYVKYLAYPGEQPIITGGKPIAG